ncbi:MAG: extracellular solute-binding protein [Clostridia bacterium]|nr:extracellular solute-binding protein [Clostridia bacterium]
MKKVLSLVLAVMLLCAAMPFAMAEEEVTLNVWSFTNEFQGMIEKYFAPSHPNIKFNFTLYPTDGGEYTSHVDTLLAADATAEDAPDIFTLEAAFVKKYVNSDWTADLKDLGFTDEDFATCIPAMLQIGQNPEGVQKGLAWQSTPGALMYRADLAEKYLGVTTPEEFQEKVADWDAFLETAEELKEASDGACKMFCATGDIWNAYQYNRSEGWVVDGKLVIDDVLYDFLDLVKTAEEEDLYAKGMAWQETWFAGMNGTNEIMCYLLPTWGLHYTLKPNCVPGADGSMSDEELQKLSDENGGTYGLWRMVAGPVGYSWGGTWVGANAAKVAAADDAKKAAIKEVIRFFTLDPDFLYTYAKDSGDFVSNNAVVDKIIEEGGTPNPFLGGQDHYSIFAQAANLANASTMTDYDEAMNKLWDDNVTQPYIKGEVDLDTAIANFKAAVSAQFEGIEVE